MFVPAESTGFLWGFFCVQHFSKLKEVVVLSDYNYALQFGIYCIGMERERGGVVKLSADHSQLSNCLTLI